MRKRSKINFGTQREGGQETTDTFWNQSFKMVKFVWKNHLYSFITLRMLRHLIKCTHKGFTTGFSPCLCFLQDLQFKYCVSYQADALTSADLCQTWNSRRLVFVSVTSETAWEVKSETYLRYKRYKISTENTRKWDFMIRLRMQIAFFYPPEFLPSSQINTFTNADKSMKGEIQEQKELKLQLW